MRITALSIVALAATGIWMPYGGTPHPGVLTTFGKQVDKYVALHNEVESKLPELKPARSMEIVFAHERKLAEGIRRGRTNARQGDIFTPEVAQEFRRLVLRGENRVASVQESLEQSEPRDFNPEVNQSYPDTIPLQSMAPSLLRILPQLPPELDYRIVGHSLALRDVRANLIVDFMPNAIP